MPKVASSLTSKLNDWIAVHNKTSEVFRTDGQIIFCIFCEKSIGTGKKYFLDAHVNTDIHKRSVAKTTTAKQTLLSKPPTTPCNKLSKYYVDLCAAFVESNIPLHKVNCKSLNEFLDKYTGHKTPDESTLRKTYLPNLYRKKIDEIKDDIGDHFVYLIVDETTDARGFYIANLLIGILDVDEFKKPYLIACKQLPATNYDTICRFVNNGLLTLSVAMNRVLLLLTDAAPYMVKAAKTLKVFYPNMIHVTCIAHGINRIAEAIRQLLPDTNKLVNNGKKAFLKAPSRISKYKEIMINLPLPPEPVITRWGTWLEAALFYAENFAKFVEVVDNLEDDAECVKKLKAIVQSSSLKNELTFLKANLSFLNSSLTKLEKQGMPLHVSIEIVKFVENQINCIPGPKGAVIKKKYIDVVSKNTGFEFVCNFAKIITGEHNVNVNNYSSDLIAFFKYAPISSVDVERSFSVYKHILNSRRYNFTELNLEMYMLVNFNATK